MQIDLTYLCTMMGNMCGIPIRIYNDNKQIFYYSIVNLAKDPVVLYLNKIDKVDSHIGYFITPNFHYYCVLNCPYGKIIVGPTKQSQMNERDLRRIAFDIDISADDLQEFVIGMKSIVNMPLESVLQMLCTLNYVLNEEKLTVKDVLIGNTLPQTEWQEVANADKEQSVKHNTIAIEQHICRIVMKGDIVGLNEFTKNAPAIRSGQVASSQLRQQKNIFIVTATQISRAAIRGGMDVDDALTLSDEYIQKCELLADIGDITKLQLSMIKNYTESVNRIRQGGNPTKLVLEVANYVLHHISEPINTERMAQYLFMSRQNLSTKFHQESGKTLTDFILEQKTEEAKNLLRYSDKTLLAISSYLGFSSQSHFARTFKKFVGLTPKEYRERHQY